MLNASNRRLAALLLGGGAWFAIMLACASPEQEEADVSSQPPEVTTSAAQLSHDYEANEVAADARYKGKIVQVTGTVDSVGKDITDTMYVSLNGGDQYQIIGLVQCFFSASHQSQLAQMQKGMMVTVKCKCDGKFGNILMKGCVM
jgi:hypothetical protein